MKREKTAPSQTTQPDLDQIMAESLQQFTLPTGPAVSPDSSQSPADAAPVEPPPPPASAQEPAREELPPDHQAPPAESAPPEIPPPPPARPAWYRHKDHQAAEVAYKNLRSQATKAEQRNAELAKELEDLKKKETIEKTTKVKQEAALNFAKQRRKQMMEEVNALDPDDNNHTDHVAEIYAKADQDILNFTSPDPVSDPPPAPQAPSPQPPAGDHAAAPLSSDISLHEEINTLLPEFGIEPNDPVFSGYASRVPSVDSSGQPMSINDQIGWALGATRDYLAKEAAKAENIDPADPALVYYINQQQIRDAAGKIIPIPVQISHALDQTKQYKAAQRSRVIQEASAPLRRSTPSSPSAPKVKDKPISLGDAVDEVQSKRRL